MKKICRTIKLRKCNLLDVDPGYIVCFDDNTFAIASCKLELETYLKEDNIKTIRYIFDAEDRIIVDRNVLINTDEV